MNSVTGAPVPYALVQAEQNARLADQNGNFRFDSLISPSVYVQAHKPGFFQEQELGQTQRPNPVVLSDRPTSTTVALIPEAVVTGHVEDPEGEPLSGLPVRLRFGQIMNGRRIWQQQGHRQTDEDGNFRIAELKPGTYYVEVGPNFRARGFNQQQDGHEKFEVVPAVYYPGVRDLTTATPVHLTAGQHVALEFSIKRVPAFHVSGMMTGVTNSGNLMLVDRDGEPTNVGVRFDGRSGRFNAFPVPAGSYRLHFNGRDTDGQQMFADVPINVDGDIPELRIPVGRTVNIPVDYETEFTKQAPNQPQVTVYSGPPAGPGGGRRRSTFNGQIRLISRDSPNRQFFTSQGGPDSGPIITGVEPGTYDVEVDSNGFAYVASITWGGLDLLHQPLVIAEGADPQPIEVVLRDDGASLNGTVQTTDTTKSGLVLMLPEDETFVPPRQVYVDPSGSFNAQEIPPGNYEILAFDHVDGLEYRNREVLNAYLSHAAHITLSADEQAKVTVDLIRTATQ